MAPMEIMLRAVNYERVKCFPLGSVVYVDNDGRYIGHAIVAAYPDATQFLEVRLENLNCWIYPLRTIRPANDSEAYPNWVKRYLRARRRKS
jgi:hypothetical protein